MSLYGKHDAVTHFHGHSVERPEIVVDGHGLAFVDAAAYNHGKLLGADLGALRVLVRPDVVLCYLFYDCGVEIYAFVAVDPEDVLLAVEYGTGVYPEDGSDKDDGADREHYYAGLSVFAGLQVQTKLKAGPGVLAGLAEPEAGLAALPFCLRFAQTLFLIGCLLFCLAVLYCHVFPRGARRI